MTDAASPDNSPVERPRKSKTPLVTGIVIAAAVVVAAIVWGIVALTNQGSGQNPAATGDTQVTSPKGWGTEERPVRLGTVGASDPYWDTFKAAALDAGIHVDIVDFASYPEPNPALTNGDIDVNQFQHIVYLGTYDAKNDEDLVPIGATAIYPLGLYSTKYASVADIPDGSTVAVPDDASNLARGLLVLQSAGLIELKDGGSIYSTIDDVDESKSKVKVTVLEAALTVTSLPDVAAAIINNDFIKDGKKADGTALTADDAIAQDDPSDPNALPYVNIFAARAEDKDDPVLQKLVEVYQSTQSVLDGVQAASGGTAVFLKTSAADLQSSLEKVIADTKAQ